MKKEGEHLQFARRQSSPLHTSFVIALFVRYNLTLYEVVLTEFPYVFMCLCACLFVVHFWEVI